MGVFESIKIAVKGLRLNILRTILTMLGIIIGIGSVITIFTIGDALEASVADTVSQFGVDTVTLYPGPNTDEGYTWDDMYVGTSDPNMTIEMLAETKEHFKDELMALSYMDSDSGTIENGKDMINVELIATNPDYNVIEDVNVAAGRFINEADMEAMRKVIVLSEKYAEEVYGGDINAPLGEEVLIESYHGLETYTVIGITKKKDGDGEGGGLMDGMMSMMSERIMGYIPHSTYRISQGIYGDNVYNTSILPKTGIDPNQIGEDVADYITETYFSNNPAIKIQYSSLKDALEEMSSMFSVLRLGLGGIAALSLLVGGIGVMNIMLVSVTERTREIGIRKSLGASINDIRLQFLIESIIVTIFGGMIGVAIGGTGGYYVSKLLVGSGMIPGVNAIGVAVMFSMFVGVFFGFYPANKAAQLDPIDALRYE